MRKKNKRGGSSVDDMVSIAFSTLLILALAIVLYQATLGVTDTTYLLRYQIRDLSNTIDTSFAVDGQAQIAYWINGYNIDPHVAVNETRMKLYTKDESSIIKRSIHIPNDAEIASDIDFKNISTLYIQKTKENEMKISTYHANNTYVRQVNCQVLSHSAESPIQDIVVQNVDEAFISYLSSKQSTPVSRSVQNIDESSVQLFIESKNLDSYANGILIYTKSSYNDFSCGLAKAIQNAYQSIPVTYIAIQDDTSLYNATFQHNATLRIVFQNMDEQIQTYQPFVNAITQGGVN